MSGVGIVACVYIRQQVDELCIKFRIVRGILKVHFFVEW